MFLRHTCKLPLKRRGCTPASKGPPSRPVRCVCSWGQGRRCRGQRGTESPPRACHKRSGGRGDVRRPREPSPSPASPGHFPACSRVACPQARTGNRGQRDEGHTPPSRPPSCDRLTRQPGLPCPMPHGGLPAGPVPGLLGRWPFKGCSGPHTCPGGEAVPTDPRADRLGAGPGGCTALG